MVDGLFNADLQCTRTHTCKHTHFKSHSEFIQLKNGFMLFFCTMINAQLSKLASVFKMNTSTESVVFQ